MAFRRFVARRGAPKTIISDNAKQFLLADKVLYEQFREIILDERTQNYSTKQGVTWRFITERAPWRGATYERLIGLVKACLKRTIGRRLLSLEELTTILIEVEQVVNLRPLARAAEDQVEVVIRPIDLLRPLTRDINFLAGDDDEEDPEYRPKGEPNLRILTRINQRTAARLQYFWKMFLDQYLLALRDRWQNKAGKGPKLREGQVVIIHNEELPRNLWKLGRVQKLSARTAEVKMVPGGTVTQRALRHLYPLEVEPLDEEPDDLPVEEREDDGQRNLQPEEDDRTEEQQEPTDVPEDVPEPELRRSKRTPRLRVPFAQLVS